MELLIASTSKIHSKPYLRYLLEEIQLLFVEGDEVLFIPYAQPSGISYDDYTEMPRAVFAEVGLKIKGIHEFDNPVKAVKKAKGVFVGGGNTFLLLQTLYKNGLIDPLRERVKNGMPYMGSSAGSNILGPSIGTSNDMPIVYPPSFVALAIVPFNINPHYLDPDPNSTHQGETRETRINEFHFQNDQAVLGLREGSWLRLNDKNLYLRGYYKARLFQKGKKTEEIEPGDISFLLKPPFVQ